MNSNDEDDSIIETEFKDILTENSCTTLVTELIKFILYHKQQLPYSFDRLKYIITKRKSAGNVVSQLKKASSLDRLFKAAEDGLTTLETLFEKTKQEFSDSSNGKISEIALLLGGSIMTPKQVYRIHIPEIQLGHLSTKHPDRKNLLPLLQSLLHSSKLTAMLTKPMNPTNMYLLIRKQGMADNLSTWFLPKNRYKLPSSGQHFHIKFRHPNSDTLTCGCRGFAIYSDNSQSMEKNNESIIQEDVKPENEINSETEWFQACAIFKGFKEVYVNGVSASDLLLK